MIFGINSNRKFSKMLPLYKMVMAGHLRLEFSLNKTTIITKACLEIVETTQKETQTMWQWDFLVMRRKILF